MAFFLGGVATTTIQFLLRYVSVLMRVVVWRSSSFQLIIGCNSMTLVFQLVFLVRLRKLYFFVITIIAAIKEYINALFDVF
jgi:hypothetical protein